MLIAYESKIKNKNIQSIGKLCDTFSCENRMLCFK